MQKRRGEVGGGAPRSLRQRVNGAQRAASFSSPATALCLPTSARFFGLHNLLSGNNSCLLHSMGICASCLGLGRRSTTTAADEAQALLESNPQAYGTHTAALDARAGLEHLANPGALGSPPRRHLRDPLFERKEREAQDRICAETNSRFIDVSWRPAPGDAGDSEMLAPLRQQQHSDSNTEVADESGRTTQTLFSPDYVLKFRETFGPVPDFANQQRGRAMDMRRDWLAHIIHDNGDGGLNWDPNTVVLSDDLRARLLMSPEDFLGEKGSPVLADVIGPAL